MQATVPRFSGKFGIDRDSGIGMEGVLVPFGRQIASSIDSHEDLRKGKK